MNRRVLLKTGIFALLGYPVFAFIERKRYRPPFKIRIFKQLKPGDSLIRDAFVLFETPTGPIAVSRRCTHLGCILKYSESNKKFLCPCHQSMFEWDGKYIKGPAKRDLETFEVNKLTGNEGGYEIIIPRSKHV